MPARTRRHTHHVAIALRLTILVATVGGALMVGALPARSTSSDFLADFDYDCGFSHGTSDESWKCQSLQNNIWFAARPSSFGNQWSGITTAVQQSLSGDYDPTDLVAYWTTTDNYPDVWLWDWEYPNIASFGWPDCPASNTGIGYYHPEWTPPYDEQSRWCRGQILRFNWAEVERNAALGIIDLDGSGQGLPLSTFNAYIACHELGHTVGLAHNTYVSCMNYGYSGLPGLSIGYKPDLATHDRNHINGQY